MIKEKFEVKKVLYPVLTAIIIGSAAFTANAVLATQQLKTEQKRLDKEIRIIRSDVDVLEKETVSEDELDKLKESTVSKETFDGLCTQINAINESLKVIEQRTYDIWKMGGKDEK